MRIGMGLNYSGGFAETAAEVADLERAGLDIVFVPEAYSFDAVSQIGYLAAKTTRLELASGIFQIYTRTPSLTAMTAAGLDFVSDGRFVMGLGASGPQVIEGFHGVPYDAPLGRTREIVDICRQVWRREKVQHQGKYYQIPLPAERGTGLGKPLKIINQPVRERIPIVIASLGPKNVAMTAEIADGWIPHLFHPERADRVWGESLRAGTAKRLKGLAPLEIAAGGMVAIGEGPETKALLDFARPVFALYVGGMGAKGKNFYNDVARAYGYEREAEEIQDLYLAGKKKEAEALIPLEWLEAANFVGPASYVKERIAAFEEAGVTRLQVMPVSDDPAATIAELKEMVS